MTATITLQQLIDCKACQKQVDLFQQTFGDSVSFSDETSFIAACRQYSSQFDFDWAADNLLSNQAREVYYTARNQAWKVYEAACKQAGESREVYYTAYKQAWWVYYAARAEAFAKLYWKEHSQCMLS